MHGFVHNGSLPGVEQAVPLGRRFVFGNVSNARRHKLHVCLQIPLSHASGKANPSCDRTGAAELEAFRPCLFLARAESCCKGPSFLTSFALAITEHKTTTQAGNKRVAQTVFEDIVGNR